MIVEGGQIALVLALIASIYAASGSILGVARRSSELLVSGRFALYSVLPLLLVSTAALVYAFVTNDFSVRYVAENSNLAMPQAYTWVAFYGPLGQRRVHALHSCRLLTDGGSCGCWNPQSASIYVALCHGRYGAGTRLSPGSDGLSRQSASTAGNRSG